MGSSSSHHGASQNQRDWNDMTIEEKEEALVKESNRINAQKAYREEQKRKENTKRSFLFAAGIFAIVVLILIIRAQ